MLKLVDARSVARNRHLAVDQELTEGFGTSRSRTTRCFALGAGERVTSCSTPERRWGIRRRAELGLQPHAASRRPLGTASSSSSGRSVPSVGLDWIADPGRLTCRSFGLVTATAPRGCPAPWNQRRTGFLRCRWLRAQLTLSFGLNPDIANRANITVTTQVDAANRTTTDLLKTV